MNTVHVSTNPDVRGQNGVFHSDEDCHRVDVGDMREVPISQATEDMQLRECKHCAGDVDHSHTGPTLAYEVLNSD